MSYIPQRSIIMHPITTTDSLDSKLASHTLSTIEHTSFPQGIAHYMNKCKSNANKTILISKPVKI